MGESLSSLNLNVSKDKMKAFLTINNTVDEFITADTIRSLLSSYSVNTGIKEDIIEECARNPQEGAEYLIAEGSPPIAGKDGHIRWFVEYKDVVAPALRPDGSVNYKEMFQISTVSAEEEICEIFPPEGGIGGVNVYGDRMLPKAGKPAVIPRGKNTQLSSDGQFVVATVSGQFKRNGASIEVLPVFEVQRNVDNETGNIKFVGNVIVRGNVMAGFNIDSGGDVEIYGFVEKAGITAAGNIVLHGGMTGMGGGYLRAGGDVYVKYVENSTISAGGTITAECIMHSRVRAGVGVELLGKKGLLVGGDIKAKEFIKAITIGSQYATVTEMELGVDPAKKDRLNEIIKELTAMKEEMVKIQQALNMLEKIKNSGKMTTEKEVLLERTVIKNTEGMERIEKLKQEHDSLESTVRKNENIFVRAQNVIYVGVKIIIGNASMVLKEDLKFCTLRNEGDEITVGPY